MGSYGDVVDLIRVSDLDLDAFAERGKELGEDHLFVPDRLIAAFLDSCLPLKQDNVVVLSLLCILYKINSFLKVFCSSQLDLRPI